MTAVIQFMSILLSCLFFPRELYYAAAFPTGLVPPQSLQSHPNYVQPRQAAQGWEHGVMPNENPPRSDVWHQARGNVEVSGLKPVAYIEPKTLKTGNTAESRWTTESPRVQAYVPQVKPRAFEIKFNVPLSETEERNKERGEMHNKEEAGYSQFYKPNQFQLERNVDSHKVYPYSGSSNYPKKDSQGAAKPGFQFSLSLPISTTVAPEPLRSGTNFENTGFSQTRFLNPQKPESKFVNFFAGLLNQPKGSSNHNNRANTQTEQGFMFKPLVPQQASRPRPSGSFSSLYPQPNYWMGQPQMSAFTNPGSVVQNPVHQAVHSPVHYPAQWYQVQTPATSEDVDDKTILQSVQYVNGQAMIPLEKCLGFKAHRHHGRVHQHQVPPSDTRPAQPQYTQFFLNMEGTAQNGNNDNAQQSGGRQEYPSRGWHHNVASEPQSFGSKNPWLGPVQYVNPLPYSSYVHKEPEMHHSHVRPGLGNYMVQLGGNVEYDKRPDTQRQSSE